MPWFRLSAALALAVLAPAAFASDAYDDMARLKGQADRDGLKEMVRQLIDISQRMM